MAKVVLYRQLTLFSQYLSVDLPVAQKHKTIDVTTDSGINSKCYEITLHLYSSKIEKTGI